MDGAFSRSEAGIDQSCARRIACCAKSLYFAGYDCLRALKRMFSTWVNQWFMAVGSEILKRTVLSFAGNDVAFFYVLSAHPQSQFGIAAAPLLCVDESVAIPGVGRRSPQDIYAFKRSDIRHTNRFRRARQASFTNANKRCFQRPGKRGGQGRDC